MKTMMLAAAVILMSGSPYAQVRTTPGTQNGGMQNQVRSGTTTAPGTMPNTGATPNGNASPGAYPGTTTQYPGTATQYPGTNTSTQPGLNNPGTGTSTRSTGTGTTPFRTYSDKNNLINNNPNPSTPAGNPAVGNPLINGR